MLPLIPTVLAVLGLLSSAGLGVYTIRTNRKTAERANFVDEKRLTVDEQNEASRIALEREKLDLEADDQIAERRRVELVRLYDLIDKHNTQISELRAKVESLEQRDEQKQKIIDTQTIDLSQTTRTLRDVRRLFLRFIHEVETSWPPGYPMPQLTAAERAMLEGNTD